jgi:hypothetical protein
MTPSGWYRAAHIVVVLHKNDLLEVMIIFDLFEGLVKDDVDEALSY